MTITIAWERRLPSYSEILICSDSRLTGGGNIDVCQKVFALPREDVAIGFCGSTLIAYPLINQFSSYIRHFKKNLDRGVDGSEIPGRFCELINHFLKFYMDPAELETELSETSFVLGYFSWKHRRPFINRIKYEKSARKYVAVKAKFPASYSQLRNSRVQFAMIGDYRHKYFEYLGKHLDYSRDSDLDLEPLMALCDMLKDPEFTDRRRTNKGRIGGAPQLLKVYPFLRTIEFGVYWGPAAKQQKLYINGRETFEFEKISLPKLSTTDFQFTYPLGGLVEN